LYYERVPTIVILASGLAASAAAVLLGGPRTGYLPGIVISTTAVLVIVWRYDPSVHLRWLAAALLVAYHGGGTLIIRSNVLAHMSVGNDAVRYDRGLHVLGGILIVLLVAETANQRRSTQISVVVTVAVGVGLLEAVEFAPRRCSATGVLLRPRRLFPRSGREHCRVCNRPCGPGVGEPAGTGRPVTGYPLPGPVMLTLNGETAHLNGDA
jgi:hypothetical protein